MPFLQKDQGEFYCDFDYDSNCYGIFHTESDGFCYALYTTKEEAIEKVEVLNQERYVSNSELIPH